LVSTSKKREKPARTNLRPIDEIFGYPERNGSRVRSKGVNEKCLLTNLEFNEKPGFYAYQNLCAIWQPEYNPHVIKYKVDVLDQGIFYGIGEEDDAFPSVPLVASFSDKSGINLIAWWLPWNAQEYLPKLAKVKISLEGIQFKNPVLIDLLDGKVYKIEDFSNENGNCIFNKLALADYPLLIVESNTIKFK
jgi:hypothetical protein